MTMHWVGQNGLGTCPSVSVILLCTVAGCHLGRAGPHQVLEPHGYLLHPSKRQCQAVYHLHLAQVTLIKPSTRGGACLTLSGPLGPILYLCAAGPHHPE